MKRLFSLMMALVMVLSLGITVFAEDPETPAAPAPGTITVTNATVDKVYTVFKIFDATHSGTSVSYSIASDSQFYNVLFNQKDADDKVLENPYFVINHNTNEVTKREGVNDTDLINYLTDIVKTTNDNGNLVYTKTAEETATGETVVFEGLPYGYYVILSSLGATVTINSNTPNVSVIDKNQEPGTDFDKLIQTGVDTEGNPVWGESNSAFINDTVTYKIELATTNYDGDKQIKYYQIHDSKGEGIWADFDNFEVYVGDTKLDRGYYICQGDPEALNTEGWEFLGTWTEDEKADINNAQWFFVHISEDQYRFTIPWLSDYTLNVTTDENHNVSSSLSFGEGAESLYDSPSKITIIYDAYVEYNATIGGGRGNLYNEASGSWISEHETGNTGIESVETYVYGIGLLKDDIATGINLAGAEFRLYKDADCKEPVYVIPTNIKGVYMVDYEPALTAEDLAKVDENMETPRVMYAAYLADYLGDNVQDNLVVSQANGKIVVLGLKAGTYYLKETKAPDGYNSLSQAIEIKAGEGMKPFSVFADANGDVADIQATDGVHTENTYNITSTVVHNSKGVELPSTGGAGTMMLITIGTIVAMAFAVLLITHKKMSVYQD